MVLAFADAKVNYKPALQFNKNDFKELINPSDIIKMRNFNRYI